ncbi:MAG: hypothetical protein CMI16_12580 [Opitutaceae bacterium]|nr:hypothetical protein [Opitutaceae bacterium]
MWSLDTSDDLETSKMTPGTSKTTKVTSGDVKTTSCSTWALALGRWRLGAGAPDQNLDPIRFWSRMDIRAPS